MGDWQRVVLSGLLGALLFGIVRILMEVDEKLGRINNQLAQMLARDSGVLPKNSNPERERSSWNGPVA